MKQTSLDFSKKTVIYMDEEMYTTLGATEAMGISKASLSSEIKAENSRFCKDVTDQYKHNHPPFSAAKAFLPCRCLHGTSRPLWARHTRILTG